MNGKLTESKINTHLKEVSEEKNILKQRKAQLEEEIAQKEALEKSLVKKKEKIRSTEPAVSDHCILRYFERILGYDLEEIKGKILSPQVIKQIGTLGSKGVYAAEDFYVVVKNKTAITVYKGS